MIGVFGKTKISEVCPAIIAGLIGVLASPVFASDKDVVNLMPGAGQEEYGSYFVDESGVPTLTNRVETYRNNPEYEEVRIEFRPIVVPNRYQFGARSVRYSARDVEYLVERYAAHYRLDPNLIYAVIRVESDFNPYAVSRAGARGLMQLMPGTAAEMRVTDIFDPAQNIAGGAQYLARLLDAFDGDRTLALAAYNAGPGTVRKYRGVPPYKETEHYVRKVQDYAAQYAVRGPEVRYQSSGSRPALAFTPANASPYRIVLKSGTTQPADSVEETETHYVIGVAGRRDTIRKELVVDIERTG